MKKIIWSIILFIIAPLTAFASEYKTDKFYIDAKINADGSVTFKELVEFNGDDYNFLERKFDLAGNTKKFTGTTNDSFYGTAIYNATGITDKCFSSVRKSNATMWNYLNNHNECFEKITNGYKGLSERYEDVTNTHFKIYNPGSLDEAFYLEYTVNDLVVVHNDVAEMMFNFSWTELIEDFNIRITLPNNSNELRIYSHGPVNGGNELIGKTGASVYWEFLNPNTTVDARIVFDKDLVPNATKLSNVNALEKIIEFETIQADKQNQIRENARTLMIIFYVLVCAWIVGLVIVLYNFYKKHDKEYKSNFDIKYYREFPTSDGPEIVGYLFTKNNIKSEYLSASILELIRKKSLKLEVNPAERNTFTILKDDDSIELTHTENLLRDWFINELGDGNKVTNDDIKHASKNSYESFLSEYTSWKNSVISEGAKRNFYETSSGGKTGAILYSLIGIVLFIIGTIYEMDSLIPFVSAGISVISIIYISCSQKRTVTGNEEYTKWNALKSFLLDFGRMNEKELPSLVLWEKYLVYATTFGIADKVEKAMNMKIKELNYDNTYMDNMTFLYWNNFHLSNSISNSISSSVTRAISTASTAASSSSSGSGFGGGASFGGGGGGFGGGGGRG